MLAGPADDRPAPLPAALWVAPMVLLLVALGPWPYGFYGLLRLVVCGAAAFIAYRLLSRSSQSWMGWAFVGLALLYNPVFRVHFDREVWSAINVASALPFALLGWRERRQA